LLTLGFLSWLNELFESPEEYGTPSVTLTGQPVKSKGERAIADYFTRHGIPYYYEAEATTDNWLFNTKISRPDFYLPRYNLFVEYWGLVDSFDAGTRAKYIKSMRWKMAQYRKNSIRFVSIYPSNLSNLDYYFRRKFGEVMGFNLPVGLVVTICPTCHHEVRDMPLHTKWHARTAH
jgi:hypothetical protein